MFEGQTSDKALISKIYKKLNFILRKWKPFLKWIKNLSRYYSKEYVYKCSIDISKKCSKCWLSGKHKLKPQGDTISRLLGPLLSQRQKTASVDEDIEKRKLLYKVAGGIMN